MQRQTSLQTYEKIKVNGLLSQRRFQVYDILYIHGPATGNELLIHFRNKYGTLYGNSPVITSRLIELRGMGVAYEVCERPCKITGHNVIEWDVTDRLPARIKRSSPEYAYYCSVCYRFSDKESEVHRHTIGSLFKCHGKVSKWKKIQ